jgi:hypothetical protein
MCYIDPSTFNSGNKSVIKISLIFATLIFPTFCLAQNYTEKSFLFLWPGQNNEDAKLNLDDPLVTDRPDFTEASSTVGKNVFQFESGYTLLYNKDKEGRVIEQSYPELLLRQGVYADWLELRLATNISSLDQKSNHTTGFTDLYLGVKIGITPSTGIFPEISIVPQITVPTGRIGSDHSLPGVNLLYAWDLTDETYLGANTQINREDDDGNLYSEWAQSIAVGTSLTDSIGCYIEWFALFPRDLKSARDEHFANGGLTYFINNNMMFDIRAGHSIEQSTEKSFYGIGYSVRFL